MNVSFRGSSDTGVRISLVQQAALQFTCHSEPVLFPGVGISIVIETAFLLKMEIATPACALVRNDREVGRGNLHRHCDCVCLKMGIARSVVRHFSQWPGSRTRNDGKLGFAMTGDSMARGLRDVYRSRKNLWKQPFIPFFQFCFASKAARTEKFPDCNKNLRKRKKWDKMQLLEDSKWGIVNKITEL